jgi:hypothetical protein
MTYAYFCAFHEHEMAAERPTSRFLHPHCLKSGHKQDAAHYMQPFAMGCKDGCAEVAVAVMKMCLAADTWTDSEGNAVKRQLMTATNKCAAPKLDTHPSEPINYKINSPDFITRNRKICTHLGYYAAASDNPLQTFRDNVSVPSSRIKNRRRKITYWHLKMGLIRCPEKSVKDYHSTLCNIAEERRSHQHRGGSLKSRLERRNVAWESSMTMISSRRDRKRRMCCKVMRRNFYVGMYTHVAIKHEHATF